ncbi:MAG: hypothetical protein ACW99A_02975 [Candidatus Kariarchaeaceae archaeon]|jgi:hypothetical protein
MELNFLDEINEKFNSIRNHSNFIIRERVYKGGLYNTAGLANQHDQFMALRRRIKETPLPENYFEYNKVKLDKIVKSIIESIEIFVTIVEGGYSKIEISKFLQVTKFELLELFKFVEEGYSFDETMIASPEDLETAERNELLAKIEDNLNQITSSSAWKEFESTEISTIVGEVKVLKYKKIIEQTINLSSNISKVDYLLLMSIVAMKIRSQLAQYPSRLMEHLGLFQTLSKIFSADNDDPFTFTFNDQILTADDLKQDVEHKINTSKLNWLVSLHHFVGEEVKNNLELDFVTKLFELSRDPKAEFLWTMVKIAKEQSNSELERISINYANLATCLLSMDYELRDKGYNQLAEEVKQIEEITALDAISDIGELYSSKDVNLDHMINAINKHIESLKNYAKKIISYEDLRQPFIKIIEFTDLDAEINEENTLEKYLDTLGRQIT